MSGNKRIVQSKDVPAIRIIQTNEKPVYVCGIDAKEIREQVNVDRLKFNDETQSFQGYQRKLRSSHWKGILRYLQRGMTHNRAIMTDAVTIALRESVTDDEGNVHEVKFHTSEPVGSINYGTLCLPYQFETKSDGSKEGIMDSDDSLGWVVDGQHRLEAFLHHDYSPGTFPIPVSFVISEDKSFNRELFIRTNIKLVVDQYTLLRDLAKIGAPISKDLAFDQLCMKIAEKLERDIPNSPFRGKIEKM